MKAIPAELVVHVRAVILRATHPQTSAEVVMRTLMDLEKLEDVDVAVQNQTGGFTAVEHNLDG